MYSRKFTEAPEQIINNGKACFGTFDGVSSKIDINGMRAPYAGLPLPSFLTQLKIKSRLAYIFSNEEYIGMTEFFDYKIFGIIELIFWNKTTGKKLVYHTFTSPRISLISKKTSEGISASYKKSRYIKVFWGRNHQHLAMKFNVKGDSARPSAKGSFFSPLNSSSHTDSLFVNPSPISSRCNATWVCTMNVQGNISLNNETSEPKPGLALLMSSRGYYKQRNKSTIAWGIGTVKNQEIIFQLGNSNLDSTDPDKYNSNILVVNGEKTALPSVVITHPFGYDKNWIIQDTENMVDLTFTPISRNERILNVIAFRSYTTKIYGTFEGVLLTAEGEKIILKNFPGIINKNNVRM